MGDEIVVQAMPNDPAGNAEIWRVELPRAY
jgi:hypothetical protein